jgi:kynurenine 3-monooxygenase
MSIKQQAVIVGGGLCGSLLAIFLAKRGLEVHVYEKRSDMRIFGAEEGRSINLALSHRGIRALHRLGIEAQVLPLAIPMLGRAIHSKEGQSKYLPYGKNEQEYINSISRSGLNMALMNIAEQYPNIHFYFDCTCQEVDFTTQKLLFFDKNKQESFEVQAEVIFGTDGGGSVLRKAMKGHIVDFQEEISFLAHDYKELEIPAAPQGGFLLEKHALHIWPRQSYMLIALPNLDGSFTVTLFLQKTGQPSFEWLNSAERVEAFFEEQFPDVKALIPDIASHYFENPHSFLGTIKTYPWALEGKALLLGDAAHAIVPFYGQGMNASFEDCIILDELIESHGCNWERVFAAYQEQRKADTDAIADLAIENFYEMRDGVADANFQKMRQLELALENQFADYHSKYSMVTFHPEIPYAEARRRGNLQNQVLYELCRRTESIESLNLEEVYQTVLRQVFV